MPATESRLSSVPPLPRKLAAFAGSVFAFSATLSAMTSCAPVPTPAPPPPTVALCPSAGPAPPLPSPAPPAPLPAPPLPASPADASAAPRHTFVDAEERALPPDASGRDYVVYVFLPESYAAHPEQRYPVVYLCDGYCGTARSFARSTGT
jgi:hypothetical protein